ncbi:sulfatase-like hydrolase/transferase [Sphaerochaeta sp.]|uniref:sulfatase-like hydrolase/transferase n=1 Tax=Sphaerochaeta sp. TaxID=1972642 RepID=UPI002FC5CB59
MDKPNILYIVTDDQRYNTINALGNKEILTPNLDALVKDGTYFDNAYIPCGLVGAVCMPSRAMLNTGRGLYDLEENGETIPEQHVLLGEHLRKNGYHAFGTGKWHNGPPAFTRSFDEGDNAFFSGMWDHWNVPTCNYDPTGAYDNVINFVTDFYRSKEITRINCDKFNPGVHSSKLLTDTTIRFIKNYNEGKPFFCYTAYLAPHDPRTMPQEFLDMYKDREITLPENFMPEYPIAYGETHMRDEVLTPYPRTAERMLSELRDYYAMITHLDYEIGRIIAVLKEKDLYNNTLIVLCGDNGLGVGSHAFLGKQNHFEHSIKVPLVFKGPNLPKNHVVESKVYLYDIFPTLCDYLGIEVPESVTGESFYNCFSECKEHRRSMYYSFGSSIRSVRIGDFKLSIYIGEKGELSMLLFNVVADPMELHNLFTPNDQRSQEMWQELQRIRREVGDTTRPESLAFWNQIPKQLW